MRAADPEPGYILRAQETSGYVTFARTTYLERVIGKQRIPSTRLQPNAASVAKPYVLRTDMPFAEHVPTQLVQQRKQQIGKMIQ